MTARHEPTPGERYAGLRQARAPAPRRPNVRLPFWAVALLAGLAAGVGYTTGLHEERARNSPQVTSGECRVPSDE